MALKVLRADVAVDELARKKFQRQIACVQELHHRNIVSFREAGTFGSAFFFTSECAGGDCTS